MKLSRILSVGLLFLNPLYCQAGNNFLEILESLNASKNFLSAPVPDEKALNTTKSLQEANNIGRKQNYEMLVRQVTSQPQLSLQAIEALISKRLRTVVIVPGLLGEFIETRAFEEIFSRESSAKAAWIKLVHDKNLGDERYELEENSNVSEPLSELVDVASIDDKNGKPLIKVLNLRTKLGSLESLGKISDKAQIFNRRLQKYVEATGDQNLILLGYSRGTPTALEMLSQAEASKLSYLKNVKALVSYAGVIFGSSLADLTEDPATDSGRQFASIRELFENLQTSESIFDRPLVASKNSLAIGKFIGGLALHSDLDADLLLKQSVSGDFTSVATLVVKVLTKLAAQSVTDFNGHVARVKKFISSALDAVDDLKTKNCIQWFRTHSLPKTVNYYSISAAMVDPEKTDLEKKIFEQKIGYNDTLDDINLAGNRRTYEKATGFALNDSQVAIQQSIFLQKVIEGLNPANAGFKSEALAVLQTHHWGISLRTVNKMNDGTMNPFPRESVLKALVAYLNQQ